MVFAVVVSTSAHLAALTAWIVRLMLCFAGLASFGFQLSLAQAQPAGATEKAEIKIAVLQFGTVDWFLDTMQHHKLDQKNGFKLTLIPLASKNATSVAFLSNSVDAIVTDWLWAMEERAKGRDIVFKPYSTALGELLVPANSPATSWRDLKNQSIGVAGGPLDKSWLIMQALFRQDEGLELANFIDPVFAAPPLLNAQAKSGGLGGVLNYWHFAARLRASGFRTLLTVNDALKQLGIDPAPALVGFVHHAAREPVAHEKWDGFARAIQQTNQILATSDEAWVRLREKMHTENMAEYLALRDGYRSGIVSDWRKENLVAAERLYQLLVQSSVAAGKPVSAAFDPQLFP